MAGPAANPERGPVMSKPHSNQNPNPTGQDNRNAGRALPGANTKHCRRVNRPSSGGAAKERSKPSEATSGPDASGGHSPPSVIRGAKWQTSQASLHWFTASYPDVFLNQLRAKLFERFGEPDQLPGRNFYLATERYGDAGVNLMHGSRKEDGSGRRHCCISIPGEIMQRCEDRNWWQFIRSLCMGASFSRIDGKIDVHSEPGEPFSLVAKVKQACESGCLCYAQKWREQREVTCGKLSGWTIYLGSRQSSKFIRVYDSGLCDGDMPAGQRERFEVEWKDDAAHKVGMSCFEDFDGWQDRLRAYILGAVDFREPDSGSDRHMMRRKRLDWWDQLIADTPVCRPITPREKTTLEGYTAWLRRTVFPTAKLLAEKSGISMFDAVERIVGNDIEARRDDSTVKVLVSQWEQELQATRRQSQPRSDATPPTRGA